MLLPGRYNLGSDHRLSTPPPTITQPMGAVWSSSWLLQTLPSCTPHALVTAEQFVRRGQEGACHSPCSPGPQLSCK